MSSRKLRIASLLPSATEIVSSLGLTSSLVGITHECDTLPPSSHPLPVLTSTSMQNPHAMTQEQIHEEVWNSVKKGYSLYALDPVKFAKAEPNIILTQSLCEVCALPSSSLNSALPQVTLEPAVISLEPTTLESVLQSINTVAVSCEQYDSDVVERADELIQSLRNDLTKIKDTVQLLAVDKPKVAFLEWNSPIFTGGHWIPEMVTIAGGEYEMCAPGDRSVEWTEEQLHEYDPDVIISGPCGFDEKRAQTDMREIINNSENFKELRAVKNKRLFVADGNSFFARPGPRLIQGTGILAACIHGEAVGAELLKLGLSPNTGYNNFF
ncbi:hypothetical protein TrLO_g8460 [Triparma laevis f. longispina]|uniref:Fe/B12 periplasmic-binding domain-containing protein n=1 Tax=Triparma laevis f. longispina TaxID=1714387 RepID=A0A9W7C0K5_9STRA|nr:hypothetical protein TrLO_g8460 [Triparma laevis f. longispina]